MGVCFPCFKSSTDSVTPDVETRRRHQIEAAERRMREQEARGIKDPERFKRQQLKKDELERRQEEVERKHAGERGGLRLYTYTSLTEVAVLMCVVYASLMMTL